MWLGHPVQEFNQLYNTVHKRENVCWEGDRGGSSFNHIIVATKFLVGVYCNEENVHTIKSDAIRGIAEGGQASTVRFN